MRFWLMGMAALLTTAGCDGGGGAGTAGGGRITMTRDAAVGAKYGAPGPRSCSPKNVPADGPPSTDEAAAHATCAAEGESGSDLYLVDNMVVTDVAPGRPYQPNQGARPNIDVTKPVYAIRGSYDSYQCRPTYGGTVAPDCTVYHQRNATGDCFQNTFGDWRCYMSEPQADSNIERNRPPPTA